MINVGRIVNSRNFSQSFTVYRKSGSWVNGRFVQAETQLRLRGTVTAINPKDLVQIPEGDRVIGMMCFYSQSPIYTTHATGTPGTSDEIVWNGERYRVYSVVPWLDFGFYKAIGARMEGQ